MVDSGSLRSKGWEKCLEALTVPLQWHNFLLSPSPLVCTRPLRWDHPDTCRTAACLPQSAPHTLITNTNSFPERNIALPWKYAGAILYRAYTWVASFYCQITQLKFPTIQYLSKKTTIYIIYTPPIASTVTYLFTPWALMLNSSFK